ncbi:MAG: FtsQ-type POTRA domain-containing protein, partial [Anaerolineales bacterium]|nr:FtsQ-type POTRA domain-containing protein [Anaerolineales bacterium]
LSKFQIQEIRVHGTTFMSPARVRTIANVLGLPTYQVDPTEIESVLTSHPEIASADVRVGWPNDIDINVEEVAPALQWNDGGNPWLVSSEGIGFLHRNQMTGLIEVYSSTPILDIGDPSTPVIEPEKVQAALDLNAILGDDAFLVCDENLGFGFQDPHGWTAYFGFGGDMAKKYHAYSRIVIQLEQSGYPATIVSVEDLSTAYYR